MTDCTVIRDLMLLAEGGEASDASQALVDEHAATCEACQAYRRQLRQEAQPLPAQPRVPLGKVRQHLKRRQFYTALLWALVAVLALTTAFAWLTRPIYLSWEDARLQLYDLDSANVAGSDDTSPEASAGDDAKSAFVAAPLGSGVTRLGVRYHRDGHGAPEAVEITAWTTILDRLTGYDFAAAPLEISRQASVYYLDYTTGRPVQMVSVGGPEISESFQELPRLALGYYAILMGIAAAVLGLLWLPFRRRRAGRALLYALLAPLCYLAAHIAVMGFKTVTFDMMRELALILLDGLALYGVAFSLIQLRREERGEAGANPPGT